MIPFVDLKAQYHSSKPEIDAAIMRVLESSQFVALHLALLAGSVPTPEELPYARHVYHFYAIRTPQRDALQQALNAQGVQTGIHYPIPVHLLPAHRDLGYRVGDFPCSEQAADEVLSLPMYAELNDDQIEATAAAVREGLHAC